MTARAALVLAVLLAAGCAHLPPAGRQTDCSEALSLSRAGDHLDAVNIGNAIASRGDACPRETEDALSFSRMVVAWADDLVRKALKQREAGDLGGAKTSLVKALDVYPRYHWVGKLLKGVERTIASRAEDLVQEAGYLETTGDFGGAAGRLSQALALLPGDPSILTRLAVVEEKGRQSLDGQAVSARMVEAQELMAQGRYDLAETKLLDISPRNPLAGQAADLLAQVRSERFARTREDLVRASEAQRAGDLEAAFRHIRSTAASSNGDADLRARTVDFARQLGLCCYSQGLLSQAREIWAFALTMDPENPKLRSYLDEAKYRLENLQNIRESGDASRK